MIAQVAHKPAILIRAVTHAAAQLRAGLLQSIPVDGLRCTLSTATDHSTMARPQKNTLASALCSPSMPK